MTARGRDQRGGERGQILATMVIALFVRWTNSTERNRTGRYKEMTERGLPGHRCAAWVRCRDSSAVAKAGRRVRPGSAGSPPGGTPVQPTGCGTQRTNQRGQSLTEMGLTVVLCVLLSLGIVEFGYVFMALNLITQ